MTILITGATGFVGTQLVRALLERGDAVVALTRSAAAARRRLGDEVEVVQWGDMPALSAALAGSDAVVNLAGEPVLGGRWSAARKRAIRDSRVEGTRTLVEALGAVEPRPKVLVSASAVGLYGDRGDEPLGEDAQPGDGFLAQLCEGWEQEAERARGLGLRVVRLRLGIVLGSGGGALGPMARLFRLGLGGRLGSGRQFVPWVHSQDVLSVLLGALDDPSYDGAYNLVAPGVVRNAELTRTLASTLRRPALLPTPAFALRLALGGGAEVLLASQRVLPRRLEERGFEFAFCELGEALRHSL